MISYSQLDGEHGIWGNQIRGGFTRRSKYQGDTVVMGSWLKDSLRSFSVAQKITIIVTTTSCVALLLSSTVLIGHHVTSNRVKMVEDLSTLATVVGNNSEPALSDGDQDRAKHLLSALSASICRHNAESSTSL